MNKLLVWLMFSLVTFRAVGQSQLRKDESGFIIHVANARVMDWFMGSLATERATREDIRQYAHKLMNDQGVMMLELRPIALRHHITLPYELSSKNTRKLNRLKMKTGKAFDRKFLCLMLKAHRQDVRYFNRIRHCQDQTIRGYAVSHLPLVKDRLSHVRVLRQKR